MYSSLGNLFFFLSTSFSIFLVCCSVVYWYFWKLLRKYKDFPSPIRSITWILNVLIGTYPKNLEYGSYAFSLTMAICKDFEKEGLVFVWGLEPILFVFGEEHTKILVNSPSTMNRPLCYNVISDGFGKGIFYQQGNIWRKSRKLYNPAFKLSCLKGQMSNFNHLGRVLADQLLEASKDSAVDVQPIIRTTTLKSIFESLFEIKELDEKRYLEVYKMISRLEAYTVYRFTRPWLYWKPLADLLYRQKALKDFHMFVKDVLEEIVERVKLRSTNTSKNDRSDHEPFKLFADILIENHLKDPSFTLEYIVQEIKIFTVAGYDTTAQTMTWCLYLLALHPEIQEKAFEDVQSVTCTRDEDLSYGDLSKLNYVEAVIKETMRLYPVIPVFGRSTTEEIQCGKYKIPKGTALFFNTFLLHRNPDIYPDPERFDPERFYGKSLKKPRAYIPFSEGFRNCIGKTFAMAEMKVFLAHILLTMKISVQDPAERPSTTWKMVLTTEKPIRFKFTLR